MNQKRLSRKPISRIISHDVRRQKSSANQRAQHAEKNHNMPVENYFLDGVESAWGIL